VAGEDSTNGPETCNLDARRPELGGRMAGLHIAAVMAIHDRRDPALACRHSLRAQHLLGGTLDVFILDDDDRAETLAECHPQGRSLHGQLRDAAIGAGIIRRRVEGRP
jgi:hypothetical protein